jgi:cytoskeletal protein RodZ
MKAKPLHQKTTAKRSTANGSSLNLAVRRAKSGISLEQISRSSNLSLRFLRAIEEERFEELPGGIFTVSYIRQYAGAIGCNADEILEVARKKSDLSCLPQSGDPDCEAPERKRQGRAALWNWRSAGNLLR